MPIGTTLLLLAIQTSPALPASNIKTNAHRPTPTATAPLQSVPPTADTEAPRFGATYRGAARARFGATLPVYIPERSGGVRLTLGPLLELHNDPKPASWLPSENWRAKLRVAASYRFRQTDAFTDVGFALEHESDHTTARFDPDAEPWFLSLNDLALEGRRFQSWGALTLYANLALRMYVATCTRLLSCDRSFDGDTTWGSAGNLTLTTPLQWASLHPFFALHAAHIAPHGVAIAERRLVLHGGIWGNSANLGFEFYVLGFWGNDTGFRRGDTVYQLGLGTRIWLWDG